MTSKVLYSNSNEIRSLIESTCGWEVTPLECLDDPEGPGELLVFDLLFYRRPKEDWSVQELLEKRPEWNQQMLPLLKARQYAYLYTGDWSLMSYVKELDRILFQPVSFPPETLEDRHCLLSTELLSFMMRQEIKRLIEPATYAHHLSKRLSTKLKRPVELGTPGTFRDVCDKLEEVVRQLDREVTSWKDRFFFDALEADEDTLCSECKEKMRLAFYVNDDRSQALKWKPHGPWCSEKECKYYKIHIFDELYDDEGLWKETPIEYVGWSDSD